MPDRQVEITQLLAAASEGDSDAGERLLSALYDELRALARRELEGDRRALTLEPTALVNEACARLLGPIEGRFESRAHFFGAAARAMRRVIVERARRALAQKRGGSRLRIDLEGDAIPCEERPEELLRLDEALEELQRIDPRKARVVTLRFFGGFEVAEIARIADVAESTVKKDWAFARAWLRKRLDSSASA